MKLLVRNLAAATTEEKLKSLFIEHGTVQSCTLVLDKVTGKSKGFGFVEMPKAGEAKAAMKTLNGYKLAGNLIRVKKAEAKKNNTEVKIEAAEPAPVKVKKAQLKPETSVEMQSNENNAMNIYGTIKKSDD
ncbi:RNA recognition motif domain-containing protein [Psychromonas aquimarina]|uniref:RNA recognition motif domain-containing protein n=1 Tax=Psychromonas aquimarina TaxID=444919 RepID=UPI000419C9C1|nr:RNA-binding protein [Psychromonas aquimarina]